MARFTTRSTECGHATRVINFSRELTYRTRDPMKAAVSTVLDPSVGHFKFLTHFWLNYYQIKYMMSSTTPYSRFQIDGALSENSLGRRGFGNSHRQKCRALLEPYLFFRNVLEIKKKKIKPVIPILPSTPLPNFFSESAPSI